MIDYYAEKSRKIIDFLIGFFGTLILGGLLAWLISFIFRGVYLPMLYLILLILLGIVIYIFFKLNRRYIGIGAISAILIPLLAMGACTAILLGGNMLGNLLQF
jgi:hypothetical protein